MIRWDSTLRELRDYIRERWRESDGVECPCCSQRVKLYRRTINRGQAEMLVALATETVRRRVQLEHYPWIHVEHEIIETGKGPARCRDWPLLRFWGLIEPKAGDDAETRRNPGMWRLTPAGLWAVEHPKRPLLAEFVEVYNNAKRGESPEKRSLAQALRRPFDFEEVRRRAA